MLTRLFCATSATTTSNVCRMKNSGRNQQTGKSLRRWKRNRRALVNVAETRIQTHHRPRGFAGRTVVKSRLSSLINSSVFIRVPGQKSPERVERSIGEDFHI